MSEETKEKQSGKEPEFALRRFKERIAAAIALIVVLGMIMLLIVAARAARDFDQIKDILLVVNPLVGVVLGYYFNKVSTEARAENAETMAQEATKARDDAQMETREAKAETESSRQQATEMRVVLTDVSGAAERMMAHVSGSEMTAFSASGGSAEPGDQIRQDLLMAVERAKRILVS